GRALPGLERDVERERPVRRVLRRLEHEVGIRVLAGRSHLGLPHGAPPAGRRQVEIPRDREIERRLERERLLRRGARWNGEQYRERERSRRPPFARSNSGCGGQGVAECDTPSACVYSSPLARPALVTPGRELDRRQAEPAREQVRDERQHEDERRYPRPIDRLREAPEAWPESERRHGSGRARN